MRLIKSNIPNDRKNSFFIKVLSGILVFCLLLVSFVFLLIYQNVKKRSLEQSYLAEQDIVSNVSYSASIMQDTASSMLTQLNGDPKLLQLIYSMDTESLSVIQSMQLLQNYTRASSWLDSVYIYCAEEDCICYAYANGNTYQLSFGTLDDFFDAAFVRNLAAVSRVTQKPAMRQLRYRSTSSDKTVFSYVLPVRTSLNRYNGFFVANISAERLMQLGYGMANGTERQLLIVDANGQTYTSGMTLLEQEQTDAVIEAVLGGAAESGQMVVQEANAICTWSRSADTDLYFISCISDSAISSQLRALVFAVLSEHCGVCRADLRLSDGPHQPRIRRAAKAVRAFGKTLRRKLQLYQARHSPQLFYAPKQRFCHRAAIFRQWHRVGAIFRLCAVPAPAPAAGAFG